jgi:hypothetical protein
VLGENKEQHSNKNGIDKRCEHQTIQIVLCCLNIKPGINMIAEYLVCYVMLV